MDNLDAEVQRSLGRIEGAQHQVLDELRQLREDFNGHLRADDERFNKIDAERNKAKGAGWVIIAILGACVSFIGSAFLAVFEGWVKFH